MPVEFTSIHFILEKLADGVYAAIAKDGGGAVSNAGFIDLGDQTIVFDTFNTQQAAEDLKNIAETLTGRSVTWVINSHWHGDHIRGNQAFRDSHIISSAVTYEQMAKNHPPRIQKQKDDIDGLKQYIQSLENQHNQTPEENLANQISFLKQMEISLPSLELVLPQYTFQNEFTFYGTERTAKLMTLGGGHSNCDAFLYLPEEKIAFLSDLLFVNSHPTFFKEPNQWINILEEIEHLDFNKAVPGHGPVGEKTNLKKVIEYISDLKVLADESDDIDNIQIPTQYQNWTASEVFKQNLNLLKLE